MKRTHAPECKLAEADPLVLAGAALLKASENSSLETLYRARGLLFFKSVIVASLHIWRVHLILLDANRHQEQMGDSTL